MRRNFVTLRVQILHLAVVGPLVRDVECGTQRAAVRVDTSLLEQIVVQLLVQVVNGVVEGQQDQLGNGLNGQVTFWLRAASNHAVMRDFKCEGEFCSDSNGGESIGRYEIKRMRWIAI